MITLFVIGIIDFVLSVMIGAMKVCFFIIKGIFSIVTLPIVIVGMSLLALMYALIPLAVLAFIAFIGYCLCKRNHQIVE